MQALAGVYADMPAIDCRGLCSDSCFSMFATPAEQKFIAEQTGRTLPLLHAPPEPCPELTMLKRCGVWESRPFVCRLWGVTEAMACPYGCRPEDGFLSEAEAAGLMRRLAALDGGEARMRRAMFEGADGRVQAVVASSAKGGGVVGGD